MRKWIFACFSVLLSVSVIVAQAGQCTNAIETALATAEAACTGLGRNQACFGNISLTATAQPDAQQFEFISVGDIVDVAAIQSLELAGFDSETGSWGVVLMQLQANLPGTLPGQNVTVLLFGDTTLRNAAESTAQQTPPEQTQTISATGNVNVRALPTTNAGVIVNVAPGTDITATGRSADNQWIRVNLDGQVGWIFAQLLDAGDANIENLLIIDPSVEQFGPMQAFYLTTGIGRPACNEIPDNGMLVQTPEGAGTVNLFVNEVEVDMGSTVYFNVTENQTLSVTPVEGAARLQSGGQTQTVVAGTRVQVPLDEDFAASGAPGDVETYSDDDDFIENLPLEPLERDIEIEAGLNDDEFDFFIENDLLFEFVDIEDIDDIFDYIDDFEDFSDEDTDLDLLGYLINELEYTDFGDELEDFFEEEGYDFSGYDTYIGDDYDAYYYDDSTNDGDGSYDGSGYGGYDDGTSYDDSGGYDDSGYDGYDDSGGYDGYDSGGYDSYDDSGGYDDSGYDDYGY